MNYLGQLLGQLLRVIYHLVGNYGVAIILFTLLMKLLMVPLAFLQSKSTQETKLLQPKMKMIQEKYKHDQEILSQKTMELYKEQHINPFSGCLPLIIQMPIVLGLFTVLRSPEIYVFSATSVSTLLQTHFLWVRDLFLPDPWIFPILAGLTTFFSSQSASSTSTSKDRSMLSILPVMMSFMIFWWSRSFPAGLTLYWVTGNIFQLFQQRVLNHFIFTQTKTASHP
ncbi:membrane protein insertase YidC [Anoxynatronum sibiricum]|uniref:Membrane protein insertase YidC n=1 Tax=Anoxynatronum sibiricum TaxID=210623 RepID=A0ABU9W0V7_9CLOT